MITANMHEAKSRLSELVKAVEEQGETVALCRDGKPVARLVSDGPGGPAGAGTANHREHRASRRGIAAHPQRSRRPLGHRHRPGTLRSDPQTGRKN